MEFANQMHRQSSFTLPRNHPICNIAIFILNINQWNTSHKSRYPAETDFFRKQKTMAGQMNIALIYLFGCASYGWCEHVHVYEYDCECSTVDPFCEVDCNRLLCAMHAA